MSATERASLFSFFITTPYIDAYEHDYEGSGSFHGNPKIDKPTFAKKMEAQAYEWGEQGVGRSYLNGNTPPLYDGRYVLAVGILGSDEKWIAVQKEIGKHTVEVVKADWPAEWDVT